MEKDSAALENRVVRDVQTFLRHVETSIQKLQKVVVDCLFVRIYSQTKNVTP